MKLGIALIVIGGGDILLSIVFIAMGYVLGYSAIARFLIDILLLLIGIRRVVKARRKGATQ